MDGFTPNHSSMNGLYNVNCDELVSDTINFNYIDNNPSSYFDGITSNIQNQISTIQNKNPDFNYSNSQSGFSGGVHFNTSNNQTIKQITKF